MIVYEGILKKLAESGYSTYRLANEHLLPGSTIDRLRNNLPVSSETINRICKLCDCQPGDFMRYVPDTEGK